MVAVWTDEGVDGLGAAEVVCAGLSLSSLEIFGLPIFAFHC